MPANPESFAPEIIKKMPSMCIKIHISPIYCCGKTYKVTQKNRLYVGMTLNKVIWLAEK
jgi:hypothetical protein